jgi:pteridine reductase
LLVAEVERAFGRLDVLVNNASTFYPTPVGTITPDQFDDLVGSNLRAPLFLSQAAAPALAKHEGLILNIGDIHGLRPLAGHAVYCVAKAGLLMLTRSMARDLGPAIRVNAIAPGPVMWPERGVDAGLRERIVARTALKRTGSADDVAKAALYFATGAPFVTGQVLAVDGGRLVGGANR